MRIVEYILEFEISVDNLHFMQSSNSFKELHHDGSSFRLREFLWVNAHEIIQINATLLKFGDYVIAAFCFEKIDKINYLWNVMRLLKGLHLALKFL